ncbi:MAG: TIGR04086 family membrane protein [Defluviitaleaceae bacterium]|nr:TIGR04086 family membrane protein [Defluviitaleaceae bacterium]MCL2836089.1 TIGR04086 family membrane protein [Defluviitaleaceae bacterium]
MKSEFKPALAVPVEKGRITAILLGVLIAYAITCIFFIGCALGLTYSSLSEEMVPTVMLIAVAVSVVVAGFDAAKGAEKNGWLWGMAAGLVYAIILICIETWVSDRFTVDSKTITSIALSIAGGGFGGVIGINFKRKK